MQDHTGTATATDPNVEYAYGDGIASNEAKYVQPLTGGWISFVPWAVRLGYNLRLVCDVS